MKCEKKERHITSDPEINFEAIWRTFLNRYPFFKLRGVQWDKQYAHFRPKVTESTSDKELFEIISKMLAPLKDGHIELIAKDKARGTKRYYNPEDKPRFWREFSKSQIQSLSRVTQATLGKKGFEPPRKTDAWIINYCKSSRFGYIRIKEFEDVKRKHVISALDEIGRDFESLDGIIIDLRDNPGGDDDLVLMIANRFCKNRQIAFHRKTKTGPGDTDFSPIKTWHTEPEGDVQFTGPVVLLTCDAVFSGAEVFTMVMRSLPHVTVIGDRTNGIFSYQLEKKLPNGWRYNLSYQVYFDADMQCYEAVGVPVDIKLLNTLDDIERGKDPLICKALEVLQAASS